MSGPMHRRSFTRAAALSIVAPWSLLARADYDKIRAGGVLKVALYKDFAPFSSGSGDNFQGVEVAMATALAKELGLKLSMLPFDAGENMADDLRNMVWRGHYLGYGPAHVMLHVPVDRDFIRENKQALIFAPYYRETLQFVRDKKKLPDLDRPEDLDNGQFAVERGTAAASALLGARGGKLKDRVTIVDNAGLAMGLLFEGKVSSVLATRAQIESELHAAKRAAADYPIATLQLNGIPPNGWAVGMAVKSDEGELAKALEAALAAINVRGELKSIFEQHGLSLGRI